MHSRDLYFVIPTYRLRDVGETAEQYDKHFRRNGYAPKARRACEDAQGRRLELTGDLDVVLGFSRVRPLLTHSLGVRIPIRD